MSEPSLWDSPCMRKPHPSVSSIYSHQIPALLSPWLSFSTWHCHEMGWSPQNPTHPGRASSHNIPWVLGPTWCFQHYRYFLASLLHPFFFCHISSLLWARPAPERTTAKPPLIWSLFSTQDFWSRRGTGQWLRGLSYYVGVKAKLNGNN